MNAKVTDSDIKQTDRLSLDDPHWLERYWELSGLPESIWRRLHKIDSHARAASHIAEIVCIDQQNRGLLEGCEVEYEPLPARHEEALRDAVSVLLDDVCDGLEDLREYPSQFKRKVIVCDAEDVA